MNTLVVLSILSIFHSSEKMNRSYTSVASKNLFLLSKITSQLFSQPLLEVISAVTEFLQRCLVVLDDNNGITVVENEVQKGRYAFVSVARVFIT